MPERVQASREDEVLVFASAPRRGAFLRRKEDKREPVPLKIEVLQQNINQFLTKMDKVVQECPEQVGGAALETIEIYVEVNSEGQVGLPGTGVSLGATAGIKFVLSR